MISTSGPDQAPVLVGRTREETALRERLVAALAGRGSLVLIGGEAGIGKTALAEALGREAAAQGALVLVGRCYDLTETPPYGPWVEAFEQLPAGCDRGNLPAPLGSGGTAASQAALFAQVRDVLTAPDSQRPVLVLLDDLQWADPASLDLLRYLARQAASLATLLLVTYRADAVARRHPLALLLPALVREAPTARLDLRPLDDAAVRTLVTDRYTLGEGDAARLVAYLRERAEGNPFYIGELLRTLEEEGALRPDGDGGRLGDLAAVAVPPLLRQVIEGRLDRLDERAQRLLAVGAVIGQDVPLDLWAAVAGVVVDALLEVIERTAEARLLEASPDGTSARFVHALIREALYEGVLPPRRRMWHRRVAEALVATPNADPDAVAYHLRQVGDDRTVEWLVRAGERAERAYAWLTAAVRFEAALALLEARDAEPVTRAELLVRLARLRRASDPGRSIAHVEFAVRLADEAGDHALAAAALFRQGLVRCYVGEYRRGLAQQEAGLAALAAVPAATLPRLARLDPVAADAASRHGTFAARLAEAGRFVEAWREAERALAAHERAPAGPVGDGQLALAYCHASMGRPGAARRAYAGTRDHLLAGKEYEHVAGVAQGELYQAVLPYQADQLAERERLTAEVEQTLMPVQAAYPYLLPRARLPLLLLEGHWADARQVALAERTSRGQAVWWGHYARSVLGRLAREQGDRALAWTLVREELPEGPDTAPGGALFFTAVKAQRLAATLALDARDLPTARAWLEGHDRWLAWSGAVSMQAEGQLGWAAYHRAAGDLSLARRHAEQALRKASEPRQPLAILAAHRLLGELDTEAKRYADAAGHLEAALALAEACAAPYERALTLLALAELRAAAGEQADARLALDEARGILEHLEAKPALARAAALAAALAVAPAPGPAYPAGLSAREVEVLRLVTAGRTDREIAELLSLSERTISNHVAHILAKTDADNRAAAAAFALRHGLA